ncbi:MAG: amidohydrolase [Rhodospirillales bacterium]|nr:amidohydrolase [Rhodospirillales bacterium]
MQLRPIFALVLIALAGTAAARDEGPRPRREKITLPFTADPYPSTYRPLPGTDTVITGATLFDGKGGRLDDASIRLRDGKIVAVGPASNVTLPPGVTVIDAHGRYVTPGIIDIHSHDGTYVAPLTSTDAKTGDVTEESDPNTANVWVEHAVQPQDPSFSRALAAGVTTIQVLPGSGNLFGGRSVILKPVSAVTVQAMKFPGAPVGLKMACGDNPKNAGKFPTSRMGEVAGMREAFIKADAYRTKWEHAARDGKEPPERDLKLDTLAGVLRGEIRVHIHCYRSADLAVMLDLAGEFGYRVAAFHHAAEAYKVADLLRARGTCAAVWSDWWGWKMEANDAIRAGAALLEAAGVCVTMHSDSPILGQRLNLEAAKAMAAGRRAGIDIAPERAMRWLSSNPAKAMGLDDRIGTLEAGKNADVVIWSGDPFSVYSKADQVYIDGALVFDRNDPRRQPTPDFEVGQPAREALQ